MCQKLPAYSLLGGRKRGRRPDKGEKEGVIDRSCVYECCDVNSWVGSSPGASLLFPETDVRPTEP